MLADTEDGDESVGKRTHKLLGDDAVRVAKGARRSECPTITYAAPEAAYAAAVASPVSAPPVVAEISCAAKAILDLLCAASAPKKGAGGASTISMPVVRASRLLTAKSFFAFLRSSMYAFQFATISIL